MKSVEVFASTICDTSTTMTRQGKYTANVYTQMTDKLLFLYAINTHENV